MVAAVMVTALGCTARSPAPAPAPPAPAPAPPTTPPARPTAPSTTAPAPAAPAPGHHGPNIDRTRVPAGNPGTSDFLVHDTDEAPSPTDADDIGAFRTVCTYSHMSGDDPLLFPGRSDAAHLHSFFGNTRTDETTTGPDTLRVPAARSTCRGGTANLSAYWVPSLIDTRTGTPLRPADGMDVYYKSGYGGVPPERIRPIPKGLRLLAGDPSASSDQTGETGQWGCSADTRYRYHAAIPACPGGQRLSMEVRFPQCLKLGSDGRALIDSEDHRSHAAYASPPGGCPASHPYAIPAITYVVDWVVPAGADSSVLRLSSDGYAGGPGGYSRHADYIEGWDDAVRDQFVRNCSSQHVDCHSHLLGRGASGRYQALGMDEDAGVL